jgi:opacity protein-like surface antigen
MRTLFIGVAVGALVLAASFTPAHAQSGARCYLEGTVSAGASLLPVSAGPSTIDLGAEGLGVSPGIGCDYILNPFFIGALFRYDFTHFQGNVGPGTSFEIDRIATPAIRAGFNVTPSTGIYGLAGYSWAHEAGSGAISSANFQGPVFGTGIEHQFTKYLSLKLEYNFEHFNHAAIGPVLASDGPDTHVVRLGLSFNFGGVNYPEPSIQGQSRYTPLK